MADDRKEYATKIIYRCSNCGERVVVKAEDSPIQGFTNNPMTQDTKHNKHLYIHGILTSGYSGLRQCKIHDCGGDNTIQYGRLELIGVCIREKVERGE